MLRYEFHYLDKLKYYLLIVNTITKCVIYFVSKELWLKDKKEYFEIRINTSIIIIIGYNNI